MQTSNDEHVGLWRDALFWVTLALTMFAVAPLVLPGYFWGANDARHHVYFLYEYDRLVQDGIWWPRWSPDFAFGYGYPFFNIYGPFSHFVAELLLHFGGLSYTAAIETVFGLSIVGSAAAMYLFVRAWAGRQAAAVAALVYVYLPYHLLNLYVRANLAESMAFVWMPLCLWAVHGAVTRPRYRWVVAAAVAYAGLMFTSNLVIVLFTPLLGLYLVVIAAVYGRPPSDAEGRVPVGRWVRNWLRRLVLPVAGLAAGLGLSAVFWLPALLERQYVRVDQWFGGRYDFRGNFVYLVQLFSPRWGFGVSQAGPDDPIGFQLGVAALVLAVVGCMLAWQLARHLRAEVALLAVVAVSTILFTLQGMAWLWSLPLVGGVLQTAQFPWRWYSVTAVCLGPLAGLVLLPEVEPRRLRSGAALLVIVAVVLLSSYPLLRVEISEPAEGPIGLAALMRFQQSSDEMTGSTAWVKEIPEWSPMADEYISKEKAGEPVTPVKSMVDYTTLNYNQNTGFVVNSEKRSSTSEEVWYWSPLEGRRIVYNQFYYPGWKAYLLDGRDGKPLRELAIIPEAEGTLGRMTVPVPVGEGFVLLRFEDTPPRVIGRWITLVSAGALALGWLGTWAAQRRGLRALV